MTYSKSFYRALVRNSPGGESIAPEQLDREARRTYYARTARIHISAGQRMTEALAARVWIVQSASGTGAGHVVSLNTPHCDCKAFEFGKCPHLQPARDAEAILLREGNYGRKVKHEKAA
jgi:hypothetical protein